MHWKNKLFTDFDTEGARKMVPNFKKTREKMIFSQQWPNFFQVAEFCPYTVKKVSHISVPSQDVTNQALSGRE